jgi:hypothetical protein
VLPPVTKRREQQQFPDGEEGQCSKPLLVTPKKEHQQFPDRKVGQGSPSVRAPYSINIHACACRGKAILCTTPFTKPERPPTTNKAYLGPALPSIGPCCSPFPALWPFLSAPSPFTCPFTYKHPLPFHPPAPNPPPPTRVNQPPCHTTTFCADPTNQLLVVSRFACRFCSTCQKSPSQTMLPGCFQPDNTSTEFIGLQPSMQTALQPSCEDCGSHH